MIFLFLLSPTCIHSLKVDVCQMELTQSKLTWRRTTQLIKVGTITSSDDLQATKKKCAEALNVTVSSEKLVLIVKGAIIDESAFPSLGAFMDALTAQQRSHLILGIGIQVHTNVHVHVQCLGHELVLCSYQIHVQYMLCMFMYRRGIQMMVPLKVVPQVLVTVLRGRGHHHRSYHECLVHISVILLSRNLPNSVTVRHTCQIGPS